jgi:hypothetical protein
MGPRLLVFFSPWGQIRFQENGTSSFPTDLPPLESWEGVAHSPGGSVAEGVGPAECEWSAVIRAMTAMGNDLKNLSNEIPGRSLERSCEYQSILESGLRVNSVKREVEHFKSML